MIKLKSLINETYKGGIPRLLYHATFYELVSDILDDGILPGGKDIQNYEGNESGVYLTPDKELAISMVETTENENIPEEWLDEIVVLTIDLHKIDNKKLFEKDPHWNPSGKDAVKSFLYREIIHPSAILKIEDTNGTTIKPLSKKEMGL